MTDTPRRYTATVTIVEHRREVEVTATSVQAARARLRRGEWDTEIGASDPKDFTVRVNRCSEVERHE